jgi:hypothetical protein
MVRFYAYPPKQVEWNWILHNIYEKPLPCIHEIVDIKVYDLVKYPHEHSTEKLKLWQDLDITGWKVVPDCPDFEGEGVKECQGWGIDSIEYSKELLLKYYDNPNNQMPVIQTKANDLKALDNYCKWFKKEFDEPYQLGVSGSISRVNNKQFVYKGVKIVRRHFPNSWIHLFAPRLHHVKKIAPLIDSFDSSNWTFPRESGKSSCSNLQERIDYFWDYVNKLNEYLSVDFHETQTTLEGLIHG